MDYPCANLYTIWSLNINSTNIFQFLVIFAQNLAILPQKPEVTHFSEVYQTFSDFWNIIETNHSSQLLSSENSHGSQICYITNSTKNLILTIVSYFLRWTLLKFFSSFPDEQSQQKVRQLGRITCAVINTSNEVKCPLLWEFWIDNFSQRILGGVFVGGIVNIRNECLFFWVHRKWIVVRNKQIAREQLRGSHDLFVPHYDSYPLNPEKKSFLKWIIGRSL